MASRRHAGPPDARSGSYVPVLDSERQFSASSHRNSSRHRVRINLPGSPQFCPLIFRTANLNHFVSLNLAARAKAALAAVPRDLLARTAAILLLKDSRSSYAIEGESAPQNRIQRWGQTIGQAGRHPLSIEDLLRLQALVIGDAASSNSGYAGRAASWASMTAIHEGLLPFDRAGSIDEDLPRETAFLESYDRFRAAVASLIDMPDRTADLLFRLLQQNNGTLSTRARTREFAELTDDEATQLEQAYQHALPPALA